jgi:PBSX family phage terminase large subunit
MFISTPKGFNHFYELYNLGAKDRDYISYHFTSYDNPHLPKDELDKAKIELTEDRFAQEYLADFRKTEGLVYKEFDRTRHLFSDPSLIINPTAYFAGIDFGFTNPTAILFIKKDYDNRFWVTQEWYKTGKTDEEVAEFVAGCKFNYIYPDPEAPASIEALRRKKINIREVIKGKDSIRNGISRVRELFKQGRLMINASCEDLIWELETYSYPDKVDLKNEYEDPIKENDHAVDALRYALMMQSSQDSVKANVFIPRLDPVIVPPVIPERGDARPKVWYPKR